MVHIIIHYVSHRECIKRLHVEEVTVYRNLYGRGEAEPYKRICDEAKPSYISKVYGHFWDMEPYYTPTDFPIQCFNELPFHHST